MEGGCMCEVCRWMWWEVGGLMERNPHKIVEVMLVKSNSIF